MPTRSIQKRPKIIRERLARCRRAMKRHRIGALLVSNPVDYRYLIGFTGEDSAVLVTTRDVHVISDGRFTETIHQECCWARKWIRKGSLNDEIASLIGRLRLRSLAVQADHLTVAQHADLLKRCGLRALRAAPPILGNMRCLKDGTELTAIRRAIRIAEEAFVSMKASIRLGQTEIELAARLEFEMRKRGSEGFAFPTICAEGANAAHPHANPGRRRVKRGSAILFDWGARSDGYCSDLTRMVFVSSIPARIREIFDVVLSAQKLAISAIRSGRRMCDVDATARDFIASAGFGEAFSHGLGHGLGLDVHEAPSLSWRSTAKLEPGMVVTVEPGIYLPGLGGVRIEDDVLVTPTGRRVLTRLNKESRESVIPARH